MSGQRRPSGRDAALAQAMLAAIAEKERRAADVDAPPGTPVLPALALRRWAPRRDIRLIDLERRAHFARLAS